MIEMTFTPQTPWQHRWRAMQRIARQEVRDTLLGWGFYLTAAAGLLVAVLLVYNSVRFVTGSGLEILSRPFSTPVLAAALIAILYTSVGATLAIARAREQGTLQVLFFAPVDSVALIGAHFLAGTALYAGLVLLLAPLLVLLSFLTNVFLPPAIIGGLLLTLFAGALAVAFGLAISALAPTSRSAVLLLVALAAVVLVIQGGYTALLNVPPTSRYYDALLFLRVLLRLVNDLLRWVSPTAMLSQLLDGAIRADLSSTLQVIGRSLAGMLFWLTLAVLAVRRRGVLP
jgi:ABC-type transport system involved in multi-copper enzyme maturation permease subunit